MDQTGLFDSEVYEMNGNGHDSHARQAVRDALAPGQRLMEYQRALALERIVDGEIRIHVPEEGES